ncbi:hypothetical protein B0H19DRAFT_1089403 [Mycena capillaripes]|nr:hypothetical protein B0H19DRAFT_1089403 [Mycena capillaripes]
MNLFSPSRKRSMRSSRIPFNPWNFSPSPSHVWPILMTPHSSSPTSWSVPLPGFSPVPFSPLPLGVSTPLPSDDRRNSLLSPSPFSPPQILWTTSPPSILLPPTQSPPPTNPSYQYQPMPDWDMSTPPATEFNPHGLSAFSDLNAILPAHIEKVRIFVETPALSYWTKQWGYATAYKRDGKAITLLDVLEAIYNYFQEPLSVDVLPPHYQGMLTNAYAERIVKAGPGAPYSGLSRVDVLNGYRVLSGMRPLSCADASGTMYVALCLAMA